MPVALKIVVIYLIVEALLTVVYVGKRIEITGFTAMLTIVTHGLMVWAILAHFAH